jgi:hypothetical protein
LRVGHCCVVAEKIVQQDHGWGGVSLTTAKNKLFLYRMLYFGFHLFLKILFYNIVNTTPTPPQIQLSYLGLGGVGLTTLRNKLFLYRMLYFGFHLFLKILFYDIVNTTPTPKYNYHLGLGGVITI